MVDGSGSRVPGLSANGLVSVQSVRSTFGDEVLDVLESVTIVLGVPELLVGAHRLRVLARTETEAGVIALANRVAVVEAEHGLGEDVENTVENHLARGSDDVAAVSETLKSTVAEVSSRFGESELKAPDSPRQ